MKDKELTKKTRVCSWQIIRSNGIDSIRISKVGGEAGVDRKLI